MVICLLIAILGFAIYAVSSIVTDRLLERRIEDIEEKMNGFVKRLDIPTIEDSTPTKVASLDSPYIEWGEKNGATSGSDMVNGLTYKENKLYETLKNTDMKSNKIQQCLCDVIHSQADFWKHSNDITSPTHLTDIEEECYAQLCNLMPDSKRQEFQEKLFGLYWFIRQFDTKE